MKNIDNDLISIADAIETGYFYNGDKFNCIDFFGRIPFIEFEGEFYNKLENYLSIRFGMNSYVYTNIIDYLNKLNVKKIEYIDESVYDLKEFVYNDLLVNNDLREKIFKYMELKKYPKILVIYSLILYKMAYNHLDINYILEKDENKRNFKLIKGGKK